jgi:glutathione S-transferase
MQIYAKGLTDISIELPPSFGMAAFRETNPLGRIPVLDIDGDMMPESEVISEYLEAVYPQPSLLGASHRETAHIRTLARIGDVYIMNNMFMLSGQTYATPRNEGTIELLAGQVKRNLKALDRMIGTDGFACCGRLTLADCALVPGLFMVENTLPFAGLENPIPGRVNVAAYWAAIQQNDHAARTLTELHRGLEERREMIRNGSFAKRIAAFRAAQAEDA